MSFLCYNESSRRCLLLEECKATLISVFLMFFVAWKLRWILSKFTMNVNDHECNVYDWVQHVVWYGFNEMLRIKDEIG